MTKGTSVCIIIENSESEILLMLRDNESAIQFPNQWVTLGGRAEAGETPEKAIRREMKEEIGLYLSDFKLFKIYDWPEKIEYVYHVRLDLDLSKTQLHEGQKIQYFKKEEIPKMRLAFHDNDILNDFLSLIHKK